MHVILPIGQEGRGGGAYFLVKAIIPATQVVVACASGTVQSLPTIHSRGACMCITWVVTISLLLTARLLALTCFKGALNYLC